MVTITLLSMAMALSLSVVVWRMVRDDRRRSEARVHALTDLVVRPDIRASAPAPAIALTPPPQPSPWGTRAAIVACLGLALTTIVLMTLTAHTRASMPRPREAAVAVNPARLELLSLRDSREGGILTIAGLVGNPRGAAALRDVKVSAELFDSSGTLVTSATAALDVRTLAAGDQSPFVLSVATARGVARYRVTFLNADGSVIQHVDRRGQAPEGSSW
jgi:hypothetical protein